MGVMRVTGPLKPQDSRCVVYLADGLLKGKYKKNAGGCGDNSHEKDVNSDDLAEENEDYLKQAADFSREWTGSLEAGVFSPADIEESKEDNISSGFDTNALVYEEENRSGFDETANRIEESLANRVNNILSSCRTTGGINSERSAIGFEDLQRIEGITTDIEEEITRSYKQKSRIRYLGLQCEKMKRTTRRRVPEMKVQTCGRGRPRKKSNGKRGGSACDKQSQDGGDGGDGRSNRGRQQRGGGQGNGCGGGRRRRDDDDRDDDNDDVEDDFDDNNEDDEEEEDEQTGTESVADETELSPEQEAEMAQELLSLIPPKNMNCDPPEKPAKPGTAVNIHGVVLHETTGGLVVLNVRWRNKIYSGALIDVRKSRWASERIKPDPFPEGANPKPADLIKMNGKRKGKKSRSPELAEKEGKEGADLNGEQTFKEPTGVPLAFKRPSDGMENSDTGVKKKARLSPPMIECPEPNCGKKYSHKNGLKYHQAHAHQNKSESEDVKPAVTISTQRASASDPEPTSTTVMAQHKPLIDQKPLIGQFADIKGKSVLAPTTESCMPAITPSTLQVVAFTKSGADLTKTGLTPVVTIKTEEESAVDSIRDVKFEESEKVKEAVQEVPKIMLESSSGDEPTELTGVSEANRMEMARPESLFSVGSQAGLAPFTSRVNYAQFSPTLNPLNPQTLNNSLSNALQTASSKSGEKFESEQDKRSKESADLENSESRDEVPAKMRLEDIAPDSIDASLRRFVFSKDVKSEDMVPSSPDEPDASVELLPGSLGPHLFPKDTKPGFALQQASSSGLAGDQSSFQASHFSVSLYNQLRQGHASRLLMGVDSVTGDLAEPSDIQRAIDQVDVRRHVSPILLNYLNTGSRARDSAAEGEANNDEVSTSVKLDANGRPVKKVEGKEASSPSSTSLLPIGAGGRADQNQARRDRAQGNAVQKPEFLQPNISAGRPIVKPATKPESITGGLKIGGSGASRFGQHGQFAADTQGEDSNQESQSTGERAVTPKNLSPTSYVDKQMIEAKTWVPKEVYWQPPQKKTIGQDRPQFSPGKEKTGKDQSATVRMGSETDKKVGSPYDHGAVAAEYMKKIEQGTSPSPVGKKNKPNPATPIPYPSTVMTPSSSETDRIKQLDPQQDNSQDAQEISRFTLTGGRSVPSPAECRGRPRKIRVEKTQQIPVGSAKDIEGSRGAPEHGSRKQTTTCSYTRTSVIHSMSTPPEELRTVTSVKEEYVSPDGKRKSPAVQHDRLAYEKKMKQDFRKAEANRIFEAEREKLKTRHVESHYANEVRNMQMRAQELQALPKGELALRGSASPSSRFPGMSGSALDKADRHSRDRMDTKSIPVSPAYGQGTSYPSHPASEIEKFRPEYPQHDFHRTPFAGSLPPVEGYLGMSTSYAGSSYYGQRVGMSQADALAQQRFEQLISNSMEQEKAFAKYSAEKNEQALKLAGEPGKHPHADRMRPSSRDGHSHRPTFYPSPLGFQTREPSNPSRSPKGSPLSYRLGDMLAASRGQRLESEIIPKDSKAGMGDGRRDIRREFGHPYGPQFFQPSYQYSGLTSNKPFSQRMGEQRSPYKHPSEMEKGRYPSHSSSQAHSGPGGMLSANLVLTKADSLGYGSVHYDSRNPDKK